MPLVLKAKVAESFGKLPMVNDKARCDRVEE
jgi:hypothetical protein